MSTIDIRSFAGGELDPALYARVDTTKYATGARTLRNTTVKKSGGTQSRPGTQFVGEVKDSTKAVRLIPFIFNAEQTYCLEFGDEYMRVIQDGEHVVDATKSIYEITETGPAVVLYVHQHGFSTGDEVYISGVGGMTQLNNRNFKIVVVGTNTFSLKYMDGTVVDGGEFSAYTTGGTVERIYTLVTPYAEADLAELQYVQSADVITLVHSSYAPRQLSREDHDDWTLTEMTFEPLVQPPEQQLGDWFIPPDTGTNTYWVLTAVDDNTGEESLPTEEIGGSAAPTSGSPITLSWDASTMDGKSVNIYRRSNGIYGYVGTNYRGLGLFTDSGVTPDTTKRPPTERDPFETDYPSAVTYFQQRLLLANTPDYPERVYTSRSGAFTNFTISSPQVQDDDAVTFSLAGRQVNEVRHLVDLGKLVVLTSGGEHYVEGNEAGILTPTDVNPRQFAYNGAATIQPILLGGKILYVQARGSIVRDLGEFTADGYKGTDLTIFSSHLFRGYTIVDWAYQQNPDSMVWAVRSDGTLLGLTYIQEQQIIAWHKHDFDGLVENVCIIPEGENDTVYLVINRDGERFIVRFTERFITDIVDYVGMDMALSYDGRNTDTSHTMTLTGSGWTYTDALTLTSSAAYFTALEVGN
jgi:hypothetical protein